NRHHGAPLPQRIPPLAMQREVDGLRHDRDDRQHRVQIVALVELEEKAVPANGAVKRRDTELTELLHHPAKRQIEIAPIETNLPPAKSPQYIQHPQTDGQRGNQTAHDVLLD